MLLLLEMSWRYVDMQNTEATLHGGAETPIHECWSCHGPVTSDAMICETCNAIQPPRALNHFERFELEPTLALDIDALEQRYFSMQRNFHPDRVAGRSARDKALSLQHATNFNEAYEILREPLSRAEYLLQLSGVTAQSEEGTTLVNDEILFEVIERREALESAETFEEVDHIVLTAEREISTCFEALEQAFRSGELRIASRLTVRLKYLKKLQSEARIRRDRIVESI